MDGNKLAPNWAHNGYTIAAFCFTLLLVVIRNRFPRSPFHPLGFVMTTSYGYAYWGPFFAVWLVKAIILRLGRGVADIRHVYHRAMAPTCRPARLLLGSACSRQVKPLTPWPATCLVFIPVGLAAPTAGSPW